MTQRRKKANFNLNVGPATQGQVNPWAILIMRSEKLTGGKNDRENRR